MKAFHNVATKHYMRATEVFHETPCRAPGLFLVSKTDLVGAEKRSRSVHDSWVRSGMKVRIGFQFHSHNCKPNLIFPNYFDLSYL